MADTIPNSPGMAAENPMNPATAMGTMPPGAPNMPEGMVPSPAMSPAPGNNANMPVQLTLQVGSVSMELGKLLEMSAGSILSDEVMSFFPKVRVLAGDRAVAEGELVQIEGKVGLRVSKLLG